MLPLRAVIGPVGDHIVISCLPATTRTLPCPVVTLPQSSVIVMAAFDTLAPARVTWKFYGCISGR